MHVATLCLRDFGVKKIVFALLLLSTACMQSRKGIKGAEDAWVWGAVDMCDTYPSCDQYSSTWLTGKLHYDSNMMVFDVNRVPNDTSYIVLASDESISYRILAKRQGEGSWRRMNWISTYEDRKIGLTENMSISVGDVIRVSPPKGYIEQYNQWILERVVAKAGKSPGFGLGEILLDVRVEFAELEEQ